MQTESPRGDINPNAEPNDEPATHGRKPGWPMARRIASWLFFALVAYLLVRSARTIAWREVWTSMQTLPAGALAACAALAACSLLLCSSFDLLARRVVGHRLPSAIVMRVSFVSVAFSLSFGALVGAVFSRYRLYARYGLAHGTITRIAAFSLLTNWMGYVALSGAVFAFWRVSLPPGWGIDASGLRWIGGALMGVALGYVALCALRGGHVFSVRGRTLRVPTLPLCLLQLALSSVNWVLMAAMVWVLLPTGVAFGLVLAVTLVGALAGIVTRVPAGLGVLEAVYVALLAHQVSAEPVIGALLAFRALYYVAPLALASVLFLSIEASTRGSRLPASAGD